MPRKNIIWCLKNTWSVRTIPLIALAFLAPIKLLEDNTPESTCAYALVVMAILWLSEALPIPVTALMPIFLFPMLGIQPGKTVCSNYVNNTSMLFLGGLIVAVAVEEVNLHTRIAMGIIVLLGSQPNMLMLGLMLPTWFLSMWISNTAATSMMVPIITAVTKQMREMELKTLDKDGQDNPAFEMATPNSTEDKHRAENMRNESVSQINQTSGSNTGVSSTDVIVNVDKPLDKRRKLKENELKRIAKGFALSVAYAANVGGVATLTGTPPNLILQGQADKIYQSRQEGADSGISFAKWMGFGLPLSLIVLVISWFWLQLVFLRCSCCGKSDEDRKKAIKIAVRQRYNMLGPIRFGEVMVTIMFIILAALWISRDISGVGGWKDLFGSKSGYLRDSTAAMLIAVSLFVLPSRLPNVFCWNKVTESGEFETPRYTPILSWKTVALKVPWGVIILLGGGFALAEASTDSGLSVMVGCNLKVFEKFEPWVMNLILCCVVAAATEITSNSATATLLMPIMAELAISIGVHPLYLMISAAVACSFAFMLPVATPPNAIVFSTGYVRIPDMAMAGIVMNAIAVLSLTLAINTWGAAIFDLDTLPDLFTNSTAGGACANLGTTTVVNATTTAAITG